MKKCNPSNSPNAGQEMIMATRKARSEMMGHSTMFNALVAERLGLSLGDLRSWDLLHLNGPITAGKFAEIVGLSGGAVTALIDRLERAGAVKREADPHDRRKVIVRTISSHREGSQRQIFEPFVTRITAVLSQYSNQELKAICRLLQEMGKSCSKK